ncbi:unnamed protein product [Pseudo-nitzschia multistriata]|uniref:DUF1995 domain-containing protein n=1 Tax=Pseudo-nitzschia multistriata TaxID=183589 RepID=A0A448ZCY6_9STRA|nr:unnamed protein product [Pseudo-nitzschia multistriata]
MDANCRRGIIVPLETFLLERHKESSKQQNNRNSHRMTSHTRKMTSIFSPRRIVAHRRCGTIVAMAFVMLSAQIVAFQTTSVTISYGRTSSKAATTVSYATTNTDSNSSDKSISDAQRLLEKAAQLRAEIATAEGKTVEQVEEEASQARIQREKQEQKNREAREKIRQEQLEQKSQQQPTLQVPVTFDDMVRQGARAVERAFHDGKTRQVVRFNLVGEEDGASSATEENQWPGGAKQMYRESGKPLTNALLREVRAPTKRLDSFPEERRTNPQLKVQDIWDFDGTALHTAEAAEGPSADIQAMVFPNTDTKYLNDIDEISQAMGKRLFLLVNPFWRNIDSWGFNILAPGAKKKAENVIYGGTGDDDAVPFEETYVLNVFSVRGEQCVALKAYPYDWQLFAFREDDYYPNNEEYSTCIRLGSCEEDPTSAIITELLNERPEFKETKTMRQMKKLG